ncbi:MAG: flagellar basal body protein [Acidocella sp.]|nr:flagellar basal body protein [Acidocella sp.]
MQIGFLNLYGGILEVRDARASLIANNIANADTPNYKAVDLPFDAALAAQLGGTPDRGSAAGQVQYRADGTVGLNGNDVSLDSERVEAAANGEEIQGAATFLHQSTADLLTALRPNPGGI